MSPTSYRTAPLRDIFIAWITIPQLLPSVNPPFRRATGPLPAGQGRYGHRIRFCKADYSAFPNIFRLSCWAASFFFLISACSILFDGCDLSFCVLRSKTPFPLHSVQSELHGVSRTFLCPKCQKSIEFFFCQWYSVSTLHEWKMLSFPWRIFSARGSVRQQPLAAAKGGMEAAPSVLSPCRHYYFKGGFLP